MKIIITSIIALLFCIDTSAQTMQRLKISDNHHFIVQEDGKPFFYLGDTAWELFHRLNREEAGRYLERRAKQGFNVIQAVARDRAGNAATTQITVTRQVSTLCNTRRATPLRMPGKRGVAHITESGQTRTGRHTTTRPRGLCLPAKRPRSREIRIRTMVGCALTPG